ncbi:MAG: ABC transporter permease [Bryobacterales bacterium]|nr:ABC transporter permease [Bryobacterales bacterium]MDE0294007.1 ABC transporter permease [Bryobacterales bacterium]
MRPLWRPVWAVLRKELVDGIRDRRSVMSALIPPLMWPLMIVLMLNFIAEKRRQADDIELPIVGARHAETLVDWLKQQRGVEVVDGPQDPYTAVRDGDVKFVIVIPEDYNELFAQSKAVEVELVIDRSDDDAGVFVRRARRLLSSYSGQIGMLRLVARGVSPAVAAPIRIDEVDVSSAQQRAAMVMAFLPMFLVLATFVGGMNIAIDTTAGERERGSLEPLLVNPAPRKSIVAGKWLASVVFAWVSVLLTFVLLQQAMERAPLESLGMRFQLDAGDVGALLAAVIPLAFLASGLQILVASFARSYKEAQTYVSFLIFVPMLPAFVMMFSPIDPQPWLAMIPLLGQHLLITEAMRGEPGSLLVSLGAGVTVTLSGLACVAVTTRLFQREKIIFGR